MSEPKWTKGPWSNYPTGPHMMANELPFGIMQNGEANMVAGVFGDVAGGLETAEANARLIALAPQLYERLEAAKVTLEEAAKLLAREFPSLANNIVNQCAIRCGDLLAKARGDG